MAPDNRSQMPLQGVILCCTSISPEARNAIAETARQMGADHKYDLTSDVTHLLVGSIDTPKYRYVAKERLDVKVLKPEWVDAVREQWVAGGDVDVAALEEEWRARPFLGLKICLTGFDNLDQRNDISARVQEHGADYSADLTREITHLICAMPTGKKYEYARSWNVKVVAIEWLNDSVERGLALEESKYDPTIPVGERGMNAWMRQSVPPVTAKRILAQDDTRPDDRKRKLRRTVSQRFESQNDAIWADITSGPSQQRAADDWEEGDELHTQATADGGLVPAQPEKTLSSEADERQMGIFKLRLVCLYGFHDSQTQILRETLGSNGAVVNLDDDLQSLAPEDRARGLLVIPHNVAMTDLRPLPVEDMQLVTEFWVEKCLEAKALLDPAAQKFSRPLPNLKIDGFEDLAVCSTGFAGMDLLHLSKVITVTGATYSEELSRDISVLLVDSDRARLVKIKYAIANNIPVLSLSWLEACLAAGEVRPPDGYISPAVGRMTQGYTAPLRFRYNSSQRGHVPHQDNEPVSQPLPDPRTTGFKRPEPVASVALSASMMQDQSTRRKAPTRPLQELPPEVNTSNRHSQSCSSLKPAPRSPTNDSLIPNVDGANSAEDGENAHPTEDEDMPIQDDEAAAEPDNSAHLNDAISALLAQKQASRPTTAKDAAISEPTKPRLRKRGLLGRASSITSNPSASSKALSRASSIDQSQASAGPATQALQHGQSQPSQALLFEDPSVQRDRDAMIRRMGGKVAERANTAVIEGAVLRDAGAEEGGVGKRVRRRARAREREREGRAVGKG